MEKKNPVVGDNHDKSNLIAIRQSPWEPVSILLALKRLACNHPFFYKKGGKKPPFLS